MENQCPGPGAGRCHGHARPEAKQKVGVKVCASAAGRPSASAPGARGWRRGGTGPGSPGPSGSRGRDRSAERGFGLPPAPEARGVLAGRGRPSLPTAEAGSSRQPVRRRERDPEPPPPLSPLPLQRPGAGVALRGHRGAGGTCPKHTHWQNSTRSTFLVLGKIPPMVLCRPATRLQRFGRKGGTAFLVYLI